MTQEKLPRAREEEGAGIRLLSKAAFEDIKELASHPEISGYVVMQLEKWIKKNERSLKAQKVFPAYEEILHHFKNHDKTIQLQYDRKNPFVTEPDQIKDDFDTVQEGLVNSALEVLAKHKITDVTMNFALSNRAEILRVFLTAGKEPPPAVIEALDAISNFCLQEEGKSTKKGVIYESERNKVLENGKGQPIIANKEEVVTIFTENLPAFLETKGITINITEQPYREKAAEIREIAPEKREEKVLEEEVPKPDKSTPRMGA